MSNEAHILLVDPEREMCVVVASLLETQGFRCLQAQTLAEARSLLTSHPISLVISELVLEDGSGFDLLPELSKPEGGAVPVIFLTAYGGVESAKEAIRKGAFDYYEKPINLKAFHTAVRQALHSSHGYRGPDRRKFATLPADRLDPTCRDDLTGLVSHRYVLGKLPLLHLECCKKGMPLSLCLIDIDGFRKINDRRGLSVGDLLLIEVGRRLRQIVRSNDIVSRYGADEFLLVLPGADEDSANRLCRRIKKKFTDPCVEIGDERVKLGLCTGVAEIDSDECANSVEFLERAVEAMHHAKLQGPGSVVVWRRQLAEETTMIDLGDPDHTNPDVESINVMMWRFRQLNRRLNNVTMESLRLLVAAVEARDPYTKHHSVRVASFARYLAGELDLPEGQVRTIYSAALLHDIGKIGVPDAILTKPGRLTAQEFQLIRQHPEIAVNILEQAQFFISELSMVRHHHEWYNGKGYPDGLAGQDIPLGSRIIQIADSTEAMFARRSYKDSYDLEHTLHQLRDGTGRQFDPMLAELAIRLIQQGVLAQLWRGKESASEELTQIAFNN